MKSIFRLAILIAALSLLFACTETTTNFNEDNDNNGRVIGSVHGIVSDANNNIRLGNIEITYAVKGSVRTTKTNNLGYYAIGDLPSGVYELTFSGDGAYAIARVNVVIPDLEDIGISDIPTTDDFYYSVSQDKVLYSLDSTVTGTIHAVVDNEEIEDLSGIRVTANYGAWQLTPDQYIAYTDSEGAFILENLPSVATFTLLVDSWTDGVHTFEAVDMDVHAAIQGVLNLEPIVLNPIGEDILVIAHNLEDFPINGTIEVTFNQSIDADEFEIELLNQFNAWVDISTITWDSSTHVTIDPDEALVLDSEYTLRLMGETINGNPFILEEEFETQPGIMIENTNMELYDGHYEITPYQSIVINFTEPVLIGYNGNVLEITNYLTPIMSWSNGNKTLTVTAPAGGYTLEQITVEAEFFSTLAPYDSAGQLYEVNISE